MISEFPSLQIPEGLARICSMNLKNSRGVFNDISDIIERDNFLKIYVQDAFSEFLTKGGLQGMFKALGWQGFRNRYGEAYIYHARNCNYPKFIEVYEVNYAIDLERRFDFLFSENNSRVFMLGMYLKFCEIRYEHDGEFHGIEFTSIPPEVDEILVKGKSRNMNPDWLIVTVWSLYNIIGGGRTSELMQNSKGKINYILNEITPIEYEKLIECLLKYGLAIHDSQFFTEEKV